MINEINRMDRLLQRAKTGDSNSQRMLFEYFFGYVKSITLRYMTNTQEAEEALNDIFLKFFDHLDSYNSEKPMKSWLRKIAVNTCIDRIRARNRIPRFLYITAHMEPSINPKIPPDEIEELLPVLQSLPPRYRAVFNLYVFEEYKHAEIGKILNISEGTSKSNYARAKALLKKRLYNQEEEKEIGSVKLWLTKQINNGYELK